MMIFSQKLDALHTTVVGAASSEISSLARELRATAGETVVAIGSGGSSASTELFSTLRANAQLGPTLVATPMEYVFSASISNLSAWLFSAGGNNADIVAALEASVLARAPRINILSSNPSSSLISRASALRNGAVHMAPVSDPKDGFLATHSLVATAVALIRGIDLAGGGSLKSGDRPERLIASCQRLTSAKHRESQRRKFSAVLRKDNFLLLHDPELKAAAVALETSFWEAGLGTVQRTDFRNFAHGRHTGLQLAGSATGVLSLTTEASRQSWNDIAKHLPSDFSVEALDFGTGGSQDLFEALLEALVLVESRAYQLGIDPGKPGVPNFGRAIYALSSLLEHVQQSNLPVRRKHVARRRADAHSIEDDEMNNAFERFTSKLKQCRIGAIVLDYDGTVVETKDRFEPPTSEIINSIVRVLQGGLQVAFATGRGGSLGESMRPLIPQKYWEDILVGYYNGGHLVSLEIDISKAPPNPAPGIAEVNDWLRHQTELFVGKPLFRYAPVQITIDQDKLRNPAEFAAKVFAGNEARQTQLLIRRSAHSFDIMPRNSSKTRVVAEMEKRLEASGRSALCIGDSGAWDGNDHELLGGPFSLSVADVCHRMNACWNLMPEGWSGPRGLVRILDNLEFTANGEALLNVDAIMTGIAQPDRLSTKEEHVKKES